MFLSTVSKMSDSVEVRRREKMRILLHALPPEDPTEEQMSQAVIAAVNCAKNKNQ